MSDNHPQLHNNNSAAFQSLQGSPSNNSVISVGKVATTGTNGEIQNVMYLAENIGSLYASNDCSDIVLKVEQCSIPAHKVILAARSDYFRALLFNGMRESRNVEVELVDTPLNGFKMLLKYVYTGRLSLSSMREELVLDILGLAHKYGFAELESAISEYLKAILNLRNMCTIYGAAHLYLLRSLCDVCLNFADKHASEILTTPGFLQLSASAIELMIQRDSLCAPEIEIFKAVHEWVTLQNADQNEEVQAVISRIRFSLIKLDDLLNIVRPTSLVSSDIILDAIKEQNEKKSGELAFRGFLLPNVNVMDPSYNAKVLTGEGASTLLCSEMSRYDVERGFTTHAIVDKNPGIVIQLGRPYIINHIKLLLWDRDQRSYRYYIEVSMDQEDWVRVVDFTQYLCRSRQMLYFSPRVVSFVRIVGTYNTVNNSFHLVNVEAMYCTETFDVDPASTLLVPNANIATIANNATVVEGVSRSRNALINGETSNYDWDNGYTCHQLGSGAIVVQLPQPYLIDSMRLLLWDCDDRHYSYYVEVSCDNITWVRVADKTQEQCKAWQFLRFERRPVVFIRLVGTHNSANEVFHCVHFECPAKTEMLMSPTRSFSPKEETGDSELPSSSKEHADELVADDNSCNNANEELTN